MSTKDDFKAELIAMAAKANEEHTHEDEEEEHHHDHDDHDHCCCGHHHDHDDLSLIHIFTVSPEGFAVSGVSAKFAGTPEAPSPRELAKPSGFD